jgi:hypothetical protein
LMASTLIGRQAVVVGAGMVGLSTPRAIAVHMHVPPGYA